LGLEKFLELVKEEYNAIKTQSFAIDDKAKSIEYPLAAKDENVFTTFKVSEDENYNRWKKSNVIEQKQKGYFGIRVRVPLGNISSDNARKFSKIAETYAADDIRVTLGQSFLLRFVKEEALPAVYSELKKIGFAKAGAGSTADITSCPGTDTCNLGISNSTGAALAFEELINTEFPDLVYDQDIKIKISGCMNSCSQHGMAQIGFHGSSLKAGTKVVPALQLLLGGGVLGNGEGRAAEKIIKFPSKRGPAVLRTILKEYENGSQGGESFNSFYERKGKNYFYQLLKPLAEIGNLDENELVDWGHSAGFQTAIGVGECAGVVIDLVETILFEAQEKLRLAGDAYDNETFADSIYHSYSVFVNVAKALLLEKEVNCNTHSMIIDEFDKHFEKWELTSGKFKDVVLKINKDVPSESFAKEYLGEATEFIKAAKIKRAELVLTKI